MFCVSCSEIHWLFVNQTEKQKKKGKKLTFEIGSFFRSLRIVFVDMGGKGSKALSTKINQQVEHLLPFISILSGIRRRN